jgi:hypothetical protein
MNQNISSLTFEDVERHMQAVDFATLASEQTLLPPTDDARLAQLGKVYRAVRPVLALAASLPLLPSPWRKALTLLVSTIEAVIPGEATASFKAGRDLEE